MRKPDNVVFISGNTDYFFRKWFEFLKPFHHLTEREMDVAISFIKQRYALSKVIHDSDVLDREVMSEFTKKKVREECNISLPHFQVIMGKLRKSQIIKDNKLNPKFIPDIKEGASSFQLLLYFKFNDKTE